jgi:hypothetical protein
MTPALVESPVIVATRGFCAPAAIVVGGAGVPNEILGVVVVVLLPPGPLELPLQAVSPIITAKPRRRRIEVRNAALP